MRERGFTFLLVVIVLASLGALVALGLLQATASATAKADDLGRKFARAQAALVAFVAETGRLPCPANPTEPNDSLVGSEVRSAPTCAYPQGTLPWKTLGLRREDAYDPWSWKISYRVYTGAKGSLTQDDGATMVLCDPTRNDDVTHADGTGDGGLCKSNKHTHPGPVNLDPSKDGFLTGKGLSVNDFGNARSDVAYVLISHGPSGYGSYTAGNAQVTSPTNASELANMSAAGVFVAASASASTVSPDDPTHFDDVINYATISDLVWKAGRGARCWSSATPQPWVPPATCPP